MASLDILFAGSGEFALPSLQAILRAGHNVPLVISQPDRPAGRGRKMTPTPIAEFALESGLPLVRTANINQLVLPPADVLLVIAFGQKIAPQVVDHPRLGGINLHASLLPRHRGAAPIQWAILSGDTVTGNSVIRLAPRMDAGAVLAQSRLAIRELETAGELHDRLALDGAALVLRVLADLAVGAAEERPQDESLATLAPRLTHDAGRIDWSRPATAIANQIRGLYPWPACHVRLLQPSGKEAGRLVLVRARPVGAATAAPGVIDQAGLVAAGEGTGLEIVELQPAGRHRMSLAAFRNGHPWQAGMRLESL